MAGESPEAPSISRWARAAFDPNRLLERENPETTHPEDIRHYIRIYEELVSFKLSLLSRASRIISKLSDDARRELSVTDVPALEEQLVRLKGRLQFWHQRLWTVQGTNLDRERRIVSHHGNQVPLTPREFELLECLLRHPLRYMTARQLIQAAWGEADLGAEQLRTYVVRLRKRIGELGLPCRLVNRPRKGYSLIFTE